LKGPDDALLPFLHAVLAIGCLALAVPMRKRLGWGYSAYVFVALFMPLFSSRDFIGLGRYAMAAFPCFLMLALILEEKPAGRWGWLLASIALLALMTSKFAMGRYVA
jgi:hypothetical protein